MTTLEQIAEQRRVIQSLKNRVFHAEQALKRAPWREDLKNDLRDQRHYLSSAKRLLINMENDYRNTHQGRLF